MHSTETIHDPLASFTKALRRIGFLAVSLAIKGSVRHGTYHVICYRVRVQDKDELMSCLEADRECF